MLVLFERGHWCAACRRHLALVSERADEILALGIQTIAITHEQGFNLVERTYPFPVMADPDLKLARAFGLVHTDEFGAITVRPSALLVDKQGKVLFSYVGDDSRDRPTVAAMLLALESLLQ
jgi:peroxiredoxin